MGCTRRKPSLGCFSCVRTGLTVEGWRSRLSISKTRCWGWVLICLAFTPRAIGTTTWLWVSLVRTVLYHTSLRISGIWSTCRFSISFVRGTSSITSCKCISHWLTVSSICHRLTITEAWCWLAISAVWWRFWLVVISFTRRGHIFSVRVDTRLVILKRRISLSYCSLVGWSCATYMFPIQVRLVRVRTRMRWALWIQRVCLRLTVIRWRRAGSLVEWILWGLTWRKIWLVLECRTRLIILELIRIGWILWLIWLISTLWWLITSLGLVPTWRRLILRTRLVLVGCSCILILTWLPILTRILCRISLIRTGSSLILAPWIWSWLCGWWVTSCLFVGLVSSWLICRARGVGIKAGIDLGSWKWAWKM